MSFGAWFRKLAFITVALVASPAAAEEPAPEAEAFFESKVRPILVEQCFDCHSGDSPESGLEADSLAGLLRGGLRGPAIVPGKAEESLLVRALRHGEQLKMPPKTKLKAEQIDAIARWIAMGAPWPNSQPIRSSEPAPQAVVQFSEEDRRFWAFQPPQRPHLPDVKGAGWVQTPVDAFILAKLEEVGLTPSPPADRRTLLRRATFDLTGLPPTPEELENFLADDSSDAFARVVDRLLASPQYGQRWGRHWLDVARYSDSNGLDENLAYANAFRYRDWVVAAFNRDKPYDAFVREQIAGDLLPEDGEPEKCGESRVESGEPEGSSVPALDSRLSALDSSGSPLSALDSVAATGFLCMGAKMLAEDDPVKLQMDIIDEQVDTVGRAFLGLTLGCARCHDHKFDPIPTADYYSLAGIFKSTKTMDTFTVVARWQERPLESREAIAARDALQKEIDSTRGEIVRVQEQATAMAVSENPGEDLRIHYRGSHLTLGAVAPRGFPRILAGDDQTAIGPDRSGRLELANWLTRPDHPLTARVIVNRVWHWRFGRGLVGSPDNFGRLGDRPTHPELLDWLAVHFVESGWSVKELHRMMLLSSTWQQASNAESNDSSVGDSVDPENRLWWKMNRRRLPAESVRDSILAVAGNLDLTMGGSLLPTPNRQYVTSTANVDPVAYATNRRSIYLPVVRSALYDVFQVFDFAEPSVSSGERQTTTIAPQALFMMNSPLVAEQMRSLAAGLLGNQQMDDAARVERLWLVAYNRRPRADETSLALEYVRDYEVRESARTDARLRAWQSLCRAVIGANEFIYVE